MYLKWSVPRCRHVDMWLVETHVCSRGFAAKPRPVSMPVESFSGVSDPSSRPGAKGRKGEPHPSYQHLPPLVAQPPRALNSYLVDNYPRQLSRHRSRVNGSSNGTFSRTGQKLLHRYLSNEGISAIAEEEPSFPLPYRGHPSVRGVDHIRGSQCFINADLHGSATIPYQEAASKKPEAAAAASSPRAPAKQSTSLLGGWLARLRLLSH